MHNNVSLTLTSEQHLALKAHLFPGDGCEAVVLLICGRRAGSTRHRLTVQKMVPIPHEECELRTPDQVVWSTDFLLPLLQKVEERDLAIVKVHSHPGGYRAFSPYDDESDQVILPFLRNITGGHLPHASVVMLPDGEMFGRVSDADDTFLPLSSINVVGDDLLFWWDMLASGLPEYAMRDAQAFGRGTVGRLQRLTIGVVGCSGTGSPLIELLARLGIGRLILVDPDHIEKKNLNRIVNSTYMDAVRQTPKVEVLARAIAALNFGTDIVALAKDVHDSEVIKALGECDVVFGCMDSIDGRATLNQIASYYLLPYFDLGVRLEADGNGGIDGIWGRVDYVQPGRSSLQSRGVFTAEQLYAASTKRTDPEMYEKLRKQAYIVNIQEDAPAVASINMQVAAMAVNDFLARLHPYRFDHNSAFARLDYLFHDCSTIPTPEAKFEVSQALSKDIGKADWLFKMPGFTR